MMYVRPKKSLGQHFLTDINIARDIVDAANISKDDIVVEIGPGNGILTRLLAGRAKKVIAIEIDERLIDKLRDEFGSFNNIEIIAKDALQFPFNEIEGRFKVAANLPYYITTPIIFHLLESRDRIISMTLMMQREVAERIVAAPGGKDYGVLSIAVQFYAEPALNFIVPSSAFFPKPKVESAVVSFRILDKRRVEVLDEGFFFKVVRAAFSQRRKTLRNALRSANLPMITDDALDSAFTKTGIDPKRRGETLSIAEFAKLADTLFCHTSS
ncbi:MAG: 16S rRNA (adenine(1518)-N(6)/adenine(1519)-N(6))-dimethyltransferase RsmA [Nitrospirota bacterium]